MLFLDLLDISGHRYLADDERGTTRIGCFGRLSDIPLVKMKS
jgi:hypothetical protein